MSAGAVGIVSLVLYVGAGTFGRWFIAEQDAAQIVPPGVPLYGADVSVLCVLYLCGVLFRGLLRNRRYPWPYGDDAFEYLPVPGHRHPVCAS